MAVITGIKTRSFRKHQAIKNVSAAEYQSASVSFQYHNSPTSEHSACGIQKVNFLPHIYHGIELLYISSCELSFRDMDIDYKMRGQLYL